MFEDFSAHAAIRYDDYARSGVRYRLGAEQLLRAVGDLSGLRVADVACGTGLLTAMLLARIGPSGRVLAIDHSDAMLRVASAATPDRRVRFVHCPAERVEEAAATPVDVICCNAAFWLFDHDRALAAFQRVLAPGGTLVFNLSDRAFRAGRPPALAGEQPVFLRGSVIGECVRRARQRYPDRDFPRRSARPGISADGWRDRLARSGFGVRSIRIVHFAIPRDEELRWMQVGPWRGHALGALTATERDEIVRDVVAEIPADGVFAARWLTICADCEGDLTSPY